MRLTEILTEAQDVVDKHFRLSNGAEAYVILTTGGTIWANKFELRARYLNI